MLEVHKELVIHGDGRRLDEFIEALSDRPEPAWSRDRESETRMECLSPRERQYVFKCAAEADRPAVSLFMVRRPDALQVTNVVPQQTGSLTRAQYNAVLGEFEERNARPVARGLGLDITITPDRLPITRWVSADAERRLGAFSRAANKGTGSSHPMDFGRWAAFLIQAHHENAPLDSVTLRRWLVEEEGWPDETAGELAIEYEFARELLKAYDAGR